MDVTEEEVRNAALEEAALVCETEANAAALFFAPAMGREIMRAVYAFERAAKIIRALKREDNNPWQ